MLNEYRQGTQFSRCCDRLKSLNPFCLHLSYRRFKRALLSSTCVLRQYALFSGLQLVAWAAVGKHGSRVDAVTYIAETNNLIAVSLNSGQVKLFNVHSEVYPFLLNDRQGIPRRLSWGQVLPHEQTSSINRPIVYPVQVFRESGPATACTFIHKKPQLLASAYLSGRVVVRDINEDRTGSLYDCPIGSPIRYIYNLPQTNNVLLACLHSGKIGHMDLRAPPSALMLICAPLKASHAHRGDIHSAVTLTDYMLLTGGADASVRLWDMRAAGNLVQVLDKRREDKTASQTIPRFPFDTQALPPRSHQSAVKCLSLSPDGRQVVSKGNTLQDTIVWSVASGLRNQGILCEEPVSSLLRGGGEEFTRLAQMTTQIGWVPARWLQYPAPNVCVVTGQGGFVHLIELWAGEVVASYGSHLAQSQDAGNPNIFVDQMGRPGPSYGGCSHVNEVGRAAVCTNTMDCFRMVVAAPGGDVAVYETGFSDRSDGRLFYPRNNDSHVAINV
eukprot:Gregarina_sp_Poly_1__560@NODE_1134_length_4985_cov_108_670394_g783_i0_p2_GENE_NODE_1134_length_4985_cov_108_670394_g783_i0NODE_1134_length_4985_cov_108_670394_g783_i0_p2_ORF_typecomplete_len499_score26_63ANAPC4_WD40/PF12894_7/0_98ANAPC4_WD40/PF12894_7/0_24ANAPC4_WD40/PF12894_7/0_41ANAPC4_WD40/PF12894_7/0_0029ANAPC4_WD40/PF12894_7/2_6e03WD40/PF00400_32/1_6e04WD40/PF00400_32/0_029WD40/PF00400_32/0_018Ge1_WD40/PF16529_5/1_3e02Ge1_WD40/PF16529_5/0_83WD40_like/PF17005_5/1_7e02WD40_like/PF17005_5/1_6e